MRKKSIEKYEKRIQELTSQCQRKTDECYQAWMSLTAANEQLEKVRMELDNRLFQTSSLGKINSYHLFGTLVSIRYLDNIDCFFLIRPKDGETI